MAASMEDDSLPIWAAGLFIFYIGTIFKTAQQLSIITSPLKYWYGFLV